MSAVLRGVMVSNSAYSRGGYEAPSLCYGTFGPSVTGGSIGRRRTAAALGPAGRSAAGRCTRATGPQNTRSSRPGRRPGRRPGPRPSRRRTRAGAIMSISTDSGPPALDRPDDVRRVRDVLDRAGYDFARVFDRIATRRAKGMSISPRDRPRLLRLTRDGDPQATLIRLFLVGVPVPLEAFRRAVAPMDPADWAGLGLVAIEGDAVRRRLLVKPFGPFLLAHDPEANDGPPRHDHRPGDLEHHDGVRPDARAAPRDSGARPGHRQRLPGPAGRRAQPAGPGHRPQPPRRRLHPVQCDAQPDREHRGGAGEPLRAGRGPAVRPDRVQPALRGLAGKRA